MAMTLVSTITVGAGGASTIEWTGIPQSGKDLLVVMSGRQSSTMQVNIARLNNDSGTNYNTRNLQGTGLATSSGSESASTYIYAGDLVPSNYTANTFGSMSFYVSNYTSSAAKNISVDSVQENNATAARQHLIAGNWTGTAAVNRITFLADFAQHSTASLYIIS